MANHPETQICYVSTNTRRLAIVAGCFSAFAGVLAFGPLSLFIPSLLVIGAVLQPRSGRPAQLLMLVSACCLSLSVLPISLEIVVGELKKIGIGTSHFLTGSFVLSLVVGLLVVWCDLALVVESIKTRHNSIHHAPFGSRSDWFVYALALILTAYISYIAVFSFHAYRQHDRVDILINWLVLALIVLLFDVGLGVHAIGRRNSQTK
jgi:hypothetical protein